MSGVASLNLPRALGPQVETGAQFAERMQARAATGFGPLVVPGALSSLFPARGLERGSVCHVTGDARVSLVHALVSSATRSGSWLAMVNHVHAGLSSMHEFGVALQRVVCVQVPQGSAWPRAVGALVDGFDIVLVNEPRCAAAEARRIVSRARAQSSVVLVLGDAHALPVDIEISSRTVDWEFSTHAASRTVQVTAQGRRMPGARSCRVVLPRADGGISGDGP